MTRSRHLAATAAARSFALVAGFIASSHASLVFAQTAPAPATSTTTSTASSPVFGMMQGVFGLLIVVGLICAAGWLMRRIGPRARSGSVVQVIGGASVGPREKVVVVRYGEQTLVLGVAPGHVGLLHSSTSGPAVDAPAPETPGFADRLRAARGRS